MFNVGRVCVKLAGRDAGKRCVVIETLENNYVLIDGETRRRKVNLRHLEPLEQTLEISEKASHEEIAALLNGQGWSVRTTKPKQAKPRLRRVRKPKAKPAKQQGTKRPAAARDAPAAAAPLKKEAQEAPASGPKPDQQAAEPAAKPGPAKKEKKATAQ